MHELIKFVEQSQIRTDLPELEIGDLIKVYLKVKEGQRERLQLFEGYLIARQGGGVRETITVRRVSYGIGVERVLPLNSPKIDHIEKVRRVRFAVLSSTICVTEWARLLESKKDKAVKPSARALCFRAVFLPTFNYSNGDLA